jgi:hypothetical protein
MRLDVVDRHRAVSEKEHPVGRHAGLASNPTRPSTTDESLMRNGH